MPPRKKTTGTRKGIPRKVPQADSFTLTDLDQVKVLADPLRIQILEGLCGEARTTKQVAQRIGEKPTKLYHHVEALERVGLIRLSRTRQNRGTLEKYYQAVARAFKADSCMFTASDAGSKPGGDALQAMVSTVFDRTSREMCELIERGYGEQGIEEEGVLSFVEIHTDKKEGRRIQAKLKRLLESLMDSCAGGKKSDLKTDTKGYRLTIAFYPMEVKKG